MKSKARKVLTKLGFSFQRVDKNNLAFEELLKHIHHKYNDFTMVPRDTYIGNLKLCNRFLNIEGSIVECGVWRGGMIAGIAELARQPKQYYLLDSFEGLPPAKEIDGLAAHEWQKNIAGNNYHNNCKAEITYAEKAMSLADVKFHLIKGWFNQTLPDLNIEEPIAILRLDGDWYESTIDCLKHLYPKVNRGGLIILDDYFAWDGCSRAVHDYLSSISSTSRIYTSAEGICYIIKN